MQWRETPSAQGGATGGKQSEGNENAQDSIATTHDATTSQADDADSTSTGSNSDDDPKDPGTSAESTGANGQTGGAGSSEQQGDEASTNAGGSSTPESTSTAGGEQTDQEGNSSDDNTVSSSSDDAETSDLGAGAESSLTATGTVVAGATENQLNGTINIVGSSAAGPLFQELSRQFAINHPDVEFNISTSNSQTGLNDVLQGQSDMALVSRELAQEELASLDKLQIFTLSQQDHVAVVTHPQTTISNLSSDQLRDIFSGAITNWQEIGGPDQAIVLVLLPADADTRLTFQRQVPGNDISIDETEAIVVQTDDEVYPAVSGQPGAIGFTTLALPGLIDSVATIAQTESWPVIDTMSLAAKSLSIDQVPPGSDDYPLQRPINLITQANLDAATQAWIDFIYSPEGQRLIEQFRQGAP